MAPLSSRAALAIWKTGLRSIGSVDPRSSSGQVHMASQEKLLQSLALAFSTFSVASAMLAFYWFIKMRRNFRQDLIMFFIQGDMCKALCCMVYPAVVSAHGPIRSNSAFCHVNGFFLALGTEASDIAVLMLTVHSALYIFRPGSAPGEGGLYPYRHFVGIVCFSFPIITASLAFINGNNAYVSEGAFCYLPPRPFWPRAALSWIPRYLILIFIIITYVFIYVYVRAKFDGFAVEGKVRIGRKNVFLDPINARRERGLPHRKRPHKRRERLNISHTLGLACNGIINKYSGQRSVTTEDGARKKTVSTLESSNGAPVTKISTYRFIWASVLANSGSSCEEYPSEIVTLDSDASPLSPHPLPAHLGSSPTRPNDIEYVNPTRTRVHYDFIHRGRECSVPLLTVPRNVLSSLRHDQPNPEIETLSPLQLVPSRGDMPVSEMLRTREKIRRQLRLSFIYPLVYVGMWIIPFALHLLKFQNRYTVHPPFGLTCASTVSICSQAAVDCWFFSTREKPWKHFHGSDGTFWGSLKFWSGWQGVRRKRSKFHGPGKTREVMTREARSAYQRREVELAEWRLEAVQRAQNGEHRTKRNWWETVDVDGEINVIQEESAIPPCGDDDDNDVYSSYSSDGEQDSARNTPESLRESN